MSKYNWSTEEKPYNDRSISGRTAPNGRRIVTDAGKQAIKPELTRQVRPTAIRQTPDGPVEVRSGQPGEQRRPGEPDQQTREEAETQRVIDRVLSEIDKRSGVRLPFGPTSAEDPGRDAEETRAIAALFGHDRRVRPEVEEIIADFTRSIMRDPKNPLSRAKNEYAKRALSVGTAEDGGNLVPPGFIPTLLGNIAPSTKLYAMATRIPVKETAGTVPTLTAAPQISYGSENNTIDESDPAFGEVEYSVKRRNAKSVMSREVVSDTDSRIVDIVSNLIRECLDRERERSVAYGNGTTQPQGIYQCSGITDVSGITAVNYANLLKLYETVDERWQEDPTFVWTFNQRVRAAVSGLVDTTGRPIFIQDATTNFKPTIFGKPVVICNHFPNTFISCLVMRHYYVFDREVTTLESTMEGEYWEKHQLALKIVERVDGKYVAPTLSCAAARSKILAGIT